jgi:hypothetical protein
MNKIIEIKHSLKSYAAMNMVLVLAHACYISDTEFGKLIRSCNVVDIEVIKAIKNVLERDGQQTPLKLDLVGTLNIVAACDIVRKMFACDAIDDVQENLGADVFDEFFRDNIIGYSNHVIKTLSQTAAFHKEIKKLLAELEKSIYPC